MAFSGGAYNIDEPLFLATARQILSDPLHPFAFEFNWIGDSREASHSVNPPLMAYLLASALALSGGAEALTRLIFLPLDLLAAISLYLLAARMLARPLLPVLIIIACPAYLLNIPHIMPEKLVAAFGFSGLFLWVRSVDEKRTRGLWAAALLFALALLSKHNAVLFLPPAAWYAWRRGVKPLRWGAPLACALLVLCAYLGGGFLLGSPTGKTVSGQVLKEAQLWRTLWTLKLRSFLAFLGGCGVATVFWPYIAFRLRLVPAAVVIAAVILLFSPLWDLVRPVWTIDRWTGIVFACGALWGLAGLLLDAEGRPRDPHGLPEGVEDCPPAGGRKDRGRDLCVVWVLSAAAVQLFLHWTVMARLVLFTVVPLIILMASRIESRWSENARTAFFGASLAGVLSLTLSLAVVDHRFAGAHRAFARAAAERHSSSGSSLWFTGHWGLQYYLEEAGARSLDMAHGGWQQLLPGEKAIVARVNVMTLPPMPQLELLETKEVACLSPLRLMSAWGGDYQVHASQAGFYSSYWGFLPYALSSEPLELFSVFGRSEVP